MPALVTDKGQHARHIQGWVLAGGNLVAGNGKALTLLEPSEGPGG